MIAINEFVRSESTGKGYNANGITAINSDESTKEKCSWICHNNTSFCKDHHVKLASPYFDDIDPIYFGIIGLLKSTGNYGLANIIFLVVIIPLTIYTLLIKSIDIQLKIRNKRRK
jgi:hypothetical protein